MPVRRVAIIATADGCGKTTFGRLLATRLGDPFVELDAINHQAGWYELDSAELGARLVPGCTPCLQARVDTFLRRISRLDGQPVSDTDFVKGKLCQLCVTRSTARETPVHAAREPSA